MVKNPPANAGDIRNQGSIPGSERAPGGGHGNPFHYSWLRIPWTEEPGGLQSIGSQRVRQDCSDLACMHAMGSTCFFKDFFLMWTIFKSLLNLLQYCFCFMFVFFFFYIYIHFGFLVVRHVGS